MSYAQATPTFPYIIPLGRMEDLEVLYTAYEKEELLTEDERLELAEEVDAVINVASIKERHGEDYESWFMREIPRLSSGLTVIRSL